MKECSKCKELKPLSEFGTHDPKKNFKANLVTINICKKCKALNAKKWREANPDWRKRVTNKINKYPEKDRLLISAIRARLTNAKSNNKRYPNRPFNIDVDYLYEQWKLQNGKCYLTGFNMLIAKHTNYTLSLDKVIAEKGYTKGNVKWCCWSANKAKGDLTLKELHELCEAIIVKCNDYPVMEYSSSEEEAVGSTKVDEDIV